MARPTPLTDAWRARLAAATKRHGGKAEAARILSRHLDLSFPTARVKIHRILAGQEPDPETVLLLEDFIKKNSPAARS